MDETYGTEVAKAASLLKLQLSVATQSAEAGINGKYLEFGKMNGFSNNFYEISQRLRMVDYKGTPKPDENTYE